MKIHTNTRLMNKHDVMLQLQQNGLRVEPVHNRNTGRFDEDLLSVNNMLCYLLPMDNTPRILSDKILTSTDFVIASLKNADKTCYYIIPSDLIIENRGSYPLPYGRYIDRWDFLKL